MWRSYGIKTLNLILKISFLFDFHYYIFNWVPFQNNLRQDTAIRLIFLYFQKRD
jgi:hypothetical protein